MYANCSSYDTFYHEFQSYLMKLKRSLIKLNFTYCYLTLSERVVVHLILVLNHVVLIRIYLTAFDKTGLPAKLNSTHSESLYSILPTPSFSQPTTIGPPAGSPRPGLHHSTILVTTEPRKAERLMFKRCTLKLPLEF